MSRELQDPVAVERLESDLETWLLAENPAQRRTSIPASLFFSTVEAALRTSFPGDGKELFRDLLRETGGRRALAETIAWCAPRSRIEDPESSLRSQELSPLEPTSQPHFSGALLESDRRDRLDTASTLFRARSDRIAAMAAGIVPGTLAGGRLVVSFPDLTTFDGASVTESRGFFDESDAPPWDTWVDFVEGGPESSYILAWVPPDQLLVAKGGIDVCALGNIEWLTEAARSRPGLPIPAWARVLERI